MIEVDDMMDDDDKKVYLGFIKLIGEENDGYYRYEFIFTDSIDEFWGEDFSGELKTVDVNIRRLRIKIEADPTEPEFLTTVWGFGYKWGY